MKRIDEIEEQASAWLAREDRGLTAPEEATLKAWLAEDTGHRVCYLRLKSLWLQVDRLTGQNLPHAAPEQWCARAMRMAAAATLVLALSGVAAWYFTGRVPPSRSADTVYATGIGRTQMVQLSDGTKVQLNTDTHLTVRMTPSARVVLLDRGEAFFDVAKAPQRPFMVLAGNRRITDIGTKFSIRHEGDNIEVLVAEGRVRMDAQNAGGGPRPVEVSAGGMIIAKSDGTLVARKSNQDIADRLSWRQGVLVFDQETLGAAAAEFNRYNKKHIVVVGSARNLRIGGRFKPENVEVFTSLIRQGFGLKIEDSGTEIIVSE